MRRLGQEDSQEEDSQTGYAQVAGSALLHVNKHNLLAFFC